MENENIQINSNLDNQSSSLSQNNTQNSEEVKKEDSIKTASHMGYKKITIVIAILVAIAILFFVFLNIKKKNIDKEEIRTITNEERMEKLKDISVMTDEMIVNEANQEQKENFLESLDKSVPDKPKLKMSEEELKNILNATN